MAIDEVKRQRAYAEADNAAQRFFPLLLPPLLQQGQDAIASRLGQLGKDQSALEVIFTRYRNPEFPVLHDHAQQDEYITGLTEVLGDKSLAITAAFLHEMEGTARMLAQGKVAIELYAQERNFQGKKAGQRDYKRFADELLEDISSVGCIDPVEAAKYLHPFERGVQAAIDNVLGTGRGK